MLAISFFLKGHRDTAGLVGGCDLPWFRGYPPKLPFLRGKRFQVASVEKLESPVCLQGGDHHFTVYTGFCLPLVCLES